MQLCLDFEGVTTAGSILFLEPHRPSLIFANFAAGKFKKYHQGSCWLVYLEPTQEIKTNIAKHPPLRTHQQHIYIRSWSSYTHSTRIKSPTLNHPDALASSYLSSRYTSYLSLLHMCSPSSPAFPHAGPHLREKMPRLSNSRRASLKCETMITWGKSHYSQLMLTPENASSIITDNSAPALCSLLFALPPLPPRDVPSILSSLDAFTR